MEAHGEGRSNPSSKKVYLWGSNKCGQLRLGGNAVDKMKMIWEPRKLNVPDITWAQVACGPCCTAALSSNGELFIWDLGWNGQLGHGILERRSVPTKV